MTRVIELIRVSSEGQAEDDRGGIPAQRAANRRTAEQYGLDIIQTIEMIDVSGAAVLFEPAMVTMLKDLGREDIHGVVTREFSRLMRPDNYSDYTILQRFKETNTLLYLPEGPLDFNDKQGRIMGTLQGLMSGLERDAIRERMMGGKEALRRMGRWAAGNHQLPFGVDYDRQAYKFSYKPEAVKVQEIVQRFLAGDQNYEALSEHLGLTRGTARNILQNPIYTGWLVYSEKRDLSSKGQRHGPDGKPMRDRHKMDRVGEEIYRHKVIEPGLISDEDFDRVQSMIAKKQELNLRQRMKTGKFVYNGFLWCAKCGARIHTLRNRGDGFYYIRSNKKEKNSAGENLCPDTKYLNRDKAEALLDVLVSKTLTDPKLLQQICDDHRSQSETKSSMADRDQLVKQYRALYARRDRFIDMAGDGIISNVNCAERLKVIDEEIRKVHEKLTEATPLPAWNPAELIDIFSPFSNWASLDRDAKRKILTGLSPKFRIANYEIHGLHLGLVNSLVQPVASNIDRPCEMKTAMSRSPGPPCRSPSPRGSCWRRL